MPELRVRKDLDDGVVEVNTGDGWDRLAPDAARELAGSYETAIGEGTVEDVSGTRTFIDTLRQYADDLEE